MIGKTFDNIFNYKPKFEKLMKITKQLIYVGLSGIFLCGCWPWTRPEKIDVIEPAAVRHLGLIMDGNRRWARQRGLHPWEGHRAGAKNLERCVQFCLDRKIPYLTVYAFSIENFKRPDDELHYLFEVLAHEMSNQSLEKLKEKDVRLKIIGDNSLFPPGLVDLIDHAQKSTQNCTALQFNILFCYGGRQEIISGVKNVIRKVKSGELSEDQLTDDLFSRCLWSADIPEPDLVIRTGGEKRLSNFLLYSLAYSELYFLDCYWPDVTEEHLQQIIDDFKNRKRNFGK